MIYCKAVFKGGFYMGTVIDRGFLSLLDARFGGGRILVVEGVMELTDFAKQTVPIGDLKLWTDPKLELCDICSVIVGYFKEKGFDFRSLGSAPLDFDGILRLKSGHALVITATRNEDKETLRLSIHSAS